MPLAIWLWVKTNGTTVGVGAPPILVYFSGDWDIHRGYDLGFDLWPYAESPPRPLPLLPPPLLPAHPTRTNWISVTGSRSPPFIC